MTFNRIAVYGHRGWASSGIVRALASSGAPIRVLYRLGSDTSSLPPNVETTCIDIEDQPSIISALGDIDIMISLVGHEGVQRQHAFIKAIPQTKVKLFVPSDLGYRYDEEDLQLPTNNAKAMVEQAAKSAGIPTAVILPGNFAESTFSIPLMGIDVPGNRIIFTGNSAREKLNICTRKYIGEAYASIFACTPPAQLGNRAIGLSEMQVTGEEVAAALEKKHGKQPATFTHSSEKIEKEIETSLQQGSPGAAIWFYRRAWGTGKQVQQIGTDLWEVEGYQKQTLEDLLVDGQLEKYRDVPPHMMEGLHATFH
ncbi:NAD(P)-binding protein [Thozetella sp. PMI_491]|nr:NAD(P)-binding protein [Thozetella sp. PMI_491]